jgi:hypothetical protein
VALGNLSGALTALENHVVDAMMQQLVAARFYSQGRIEMPLLQTTAHVMKVVGMLDTDVDLSKMVDPSFLPADLQK